jgi:triosephosphate isomerase
MRTPFLAANWKMFKTVDETVAYLREFCALAASVAGAEIVVAPPFTALRAAADVTKAIGNARARSPAKSARR